MSTKIFFDSEKNVHHLQCSTLGDPAPNKEIADLCSVVEIQAEIPALGEIESISESNGQIRVSARGTWIYDASSLEEITQVVLAPE